MTNKDKIIFHIDINAFFARCEEIIDPWLATKPFVIANRSDNSIVCSASSHARKFGIKAAMKVIEAKKRCPDVITIAPNYLFYKKKSNEFFECIRKNFSKQIEILSIDECYLDVSNILISYHDNVDILATNIINKVFEETKLKITIGIGKNKFIAKIAGDLKPKNLISKITNDEIFEKVWNMPIDKILNIGKKTQALLLELNIRKVIDFLKYEDQLKLERLLHKKYFLLLKYFFGISDDEVKINEKEKSISQSRNLNVPTTDYFSLIKMLKFLAKEISLILIARDIFTSKITISIKYASSNKLKSKTKRLEIPINSFDEIYKEAKTIFNQIYDEQIPLINIAINVSDLFFKN